MFGRHRPILFSLAESWLPQQLFGNCWTFVRKCWSTSDLAGIAKSSSCSRCVASDVVATFRVIRSSLPQPATIYCMSKYNRPVTCTARASTILGWVQLPPHLVLCNMNTRALALELKIVAQVGLTLVERDHFSQCWPKVASKARECHGEIRRLVAPWRRDGFYSKVKA